MCSFQIFLQSMKFYFLRLYPINFFTQCHLKKMREYPQIGLEPNMYAITWSFSQVVVDIVSFNINLSSLIIHLSQIILFANIIQLLKVLSPWVFMLITFFNIFFKYVILVLFCVYSSFSILIIFNLLGQFGCMCLFLGSLIFIYFFRIMYENKFEIILSILEYFNYKLNN